MLSGPRWVVCRRSRLLIRTPRRRPDGLSALQVIWVVFEKRIRNIPPLVFYSWFRPEQRFLRRTNLEQENRK
jgi:hypothetical protein